MRYDRCLVISGISRSKNLSHQHDHPRAFFRVEQRLRHPEQAKRWYTDALSACTLLPANTPAPRSGIHFRMYAATFW
jgi:hypothetical protein